MAPTVKHRTLHQPHSIHWLDLFFLIILHLFQPSWCKRSGTLIRDRPKPSSRPGTSRKTSRTDWHFYSFRHRFQFKTFCETVWSKANMSGEIIQQDLEWVTQTLSLMSVNCIICTHCAVCLLNKTVGWDKQNKSLLELKMALLLWEWQYSNDEGLTAD